MLPCITQKICLNESDCETFCTFWNFGNSSKGLAGQLLKIKDQYECLVKVIEKMESAMYTIKEAVKAIQELDFGEEKRTQNNNISEIINMEM